jgi:alanine dehydrogenase
MRVGCPKEIKNHEYRVGLTPARFANMSPTATRSGSKQRPAPASAPTMPPMPAPAPNRATAKDIFEKCDMIVKVKEPQPSEWAQLRDGQILYTYLHLAPDPEQTKGLLAPA